MNLSKIRILIAGNPFRFAKELQNKLPLHYDPIVCEGMEKVREIIPVYRADLVVHIAVRREFSEEGVDTDFDIPCLLLDASVLHKSAEELDELILKRRESPDNRIRNPLQNLLGASPSQEELRLKLQKAAMVDYPVLLEGEMGTGKDTAAQVLHQISAKRCLPFVHFPCLALEEAKLEQAIYDSLRQPLPLGENKEIPFKKSLGGSFFLNGLDELSPYQQSALLRLLTPGVTGKTTKVLDGQIWRLISAVTQSNTLKKEILFKVGILFIRIAPLRERREDIPVLVRHFLDQAGYKQCLIEKSALEKLKAHDWPGNLVELKNTLQSAVTYYSPTRISAANLQFLSCPPQDAKAEFVRAKP